MADHLGSSRHGGGVNRGMRKQRRPLDTRRPIHLTMRSSRARGAWSLLHPRHVRLLDAFVARTARKWRIRIHERANVGNHLHLLIRARSRRDFQGFLRELAGGIAMRVTGARKSAELAGGHFWDDLAFTRVVHWGRDLQRTVQYIVTNAFEAAGLLSSSEKAAGIRAVNARFADSS
jgi:REP element-mobilizing transposase RayT